MKNKLKILTFVCICFLLVGFAGINTTLFSFGSTTIGINLDDKDIYIGNLYVNGINRFNSISDDMNSFSLDIGENSTIEFYVVNNGTQYDQEITITCINNGLTLNYDYAKTVYAGETLKGNITTTGVTSEELICSLKSIPKSRTSKVTDKKIVLFNIDGYENETVYKVVTGNTYGELPNIELEGYEFLGWYNQQAELVESTTTVTSFSDEVLTGKLEMVYCPYDDGTIWEFDYTGGQQIFDAPCEGTYKLETWGAQGYSYSTSLYGGYGSYSVGNVTLDIAKRLFIYVGQKGNGGFGSFSSYPNGGIGNGANSSATVYGGSGGGSSHILLKSVDLSSLSNDKNSIIMVSGGGGSSVYYSGWNGIGGAGGGFTGNTGIRVTVDVGNWTAGTGGTQSAGGTAGSAGGTNGMFGIGGSSNNSWGAGGGGGYYGGGPSNGSSGGGGSGYIGNTLLTNKVMYCYNCATSNVESTKTETTTCTNSIPKENCSKQGNGYARITLVKSSKPKVQLGTTWEFKYNGTNGTDGSSQKFVIPVSGTYKIETWGAQGGVYALSNYNSNNSYGAYAVANHDFDSGKEVFIYVGGQGEQGIGGHDNLGGYNGGGSSGYHRGGLSNLNLAFSGLGGGGATHMSLEDKLLVNLSSYAGKNDSPILIVSAGGGGMSWAGSTNLPGIGGAGGGISGNSGEVCSGCATTRTAGATQTAGYQFGKGEDLVVYSASSRKYISNNVSGNCGGGGGGGYYGGYTFHACRTVGGSGGSSYIANNYNTNAAMYCFNCQESTAVATKTIKTNGTNSSLDKTNCPSGYSSNPISKCAKAGHGYARITLISYK